MNESLETICYEDEAHEKESMCAIVYLTEDFIQCEGVYPYFKAIGKLVCKLEDEIHDHLNDGYEVTKREDFIDLEGDTGYLWCVEFKDKKEPTRTDSVTYYLLWKDGC